MIFCVPGRYRSSRAGVATAPVLGVFNDIFYFLLLKDCILIECLLVSCWGEVNTTQPVQGGGRIDMLAVLFVESLSAVKLEQVGKGGLPSLSQFNLLRAHNYF